MEGFIMLVMRCIFYRCGLVVDGGKKAGVD
jgi:hypothetical protein